MVRMITTAWLLLLSFFFVHGQDQTQADDYTLYDLLDPASQSFRILYDVSATTAGAKFYFNTLRKGSEHNITAVYDLMTGAPLPWVVVGGVQAQINGYSKAASDKEYLQVTLARPVPLHGEARIRIDKTYKDPNSYFLKDDKLVFTRSLGIKRNAVTLPAGYELLSCNYPSQVETQNGRTKVSFMNRSAAPIDYRIEARKLPAENPKAQDPSTPSWINEQGAPQGRNKTNARLHYQVDERAFQDREIVYFLQQPETNSFSLYHDYTETRVGVNKYLNVVRPGSKVSNPSAILLDTGEPLKVETLKGKQITDKDIDIGGQINDGTEVVVIWFDPVQKGASARLRIEETYTDPRRYLLYNDELIWDRAFGRPRNTVVLPHNWRLLTCSIPAVVSTTPDGKIQLYFENDRPDEIDVFIRGGRKQ